MCQRGNEEEEEDEEAVEEEEEEGKGAFMKLLERCGGLESGYFVRQRYLLYGSFEPLLKITDNSTLANQNSQCFLILLKANVRAFTATIHMISLTKIHDDTFVTSLYI